MERISRHQMFMGMAEMAAQRSTCGRANVGAILVSDNRILSMGYNGPPSGETHCTGLHCATEGKCMRAVHAEANAVKFAAEAGKAPDMIEATMYTTVSPCNSCSLILLAYGIEHVFFRQPYRDTSSLLSLIESGVRVTRILPSGQLVHGITGEML